MFLSQVGGIRVEVFAHAYKIPEKLVEYTYKFTAKLVKSILHVGLVRRPAELSSKRLFRASFCAARTLSS